MIYIPALCRLGVSADVDNDNALDEDNSVLSEKLVFSVFVACSEFSLAVVVVTSIVVVSVFDEVALVAHVVVDTYDDDEHLTLYR